MNNLTFLLSFLFGCSLLLVSQNTRAQALQNKSLQQQGAVVLPHSSKNASNQFHGLDSRPSAWRQRHRAGNGRWQGQQHKVYGHGQLHLANAL